MATGRRAKSDPDMSREYDFSKGVRGKYAARFARMKLKVMLDPDVAAALPTSDAVNQALRPLAKLIVARTSRRAATRKPRKAG